MAEDSSLSEPKAEKSRKSKSKATTPVFILSANLQQTLF